MIAQASCYFFCRATHDQETILRSIAQAGASVSLGDPVNTKGAAVVFFDDITDRVFDFLQQMSRQGQRRVLAVSINDKGLSADQVWAFTHSGASDVICWSSQGLAQRIAARLCRWDQIESLLDSPRVQNFLVGHSSSWICILRQIMEVAHFTNSSILIVGETGTGKEAVACLIHDLNQRPDKREMVIVDCTTIVPELSGSEFFGHERGAFTSAFSSRDGAFALAHLGTLFLDEVSELPLTLQAQLLRVIHEHSFKRVGGNSWQKTLFNLVCASNKDLTEEVKQGRFRHDLYHRLANWTFRLPALRERMDDISSLAQHFLRQLQGDQKPLEFDQAVRDYILHREYPGNVRELKQLISRIMDRHVGPGVITAGDLPEEERSKTPAEGLHWRGDSFKLSIQTALELGIGLKKLSRLTEETAVEVALEEENGNLRRAARKLQISQRALQMRRAETRKKYSA